MTDMHEEHESEFNPGTTGEHDSRSQAFIAGLIIAALTAIAITLIVAATFNERASDIIWPLVATTLGGLVSQLNAPNGVASAIASAAKSLLPKS